MNRLNFSPSNSRHAPIGLVTLVQEVDDHHVVLLAVTMASADALLDPLWIPWQVVVDDQRAELEVHTLSSRLRREQDRRLIAEVLDQSSANINRA